MEREITKKDHYNVRENGKIIKFSGGPHYLSTILLKYFYLFKIIESIINFYLKKFSN